MMSTSSKLAVDMHMWTNHSETSVQLLYDNKKEPKTAFIWWKWIDVVKDERKMIHILFIYFRKHELSVTSSAEMHELNRYWF
jgi:hypothetical protein